MNPTLYAAATLLTVTVTLVVVGCTLWLARQARRREREMVHGTRRPLLQRWFNFSQLVVQARERGVGLAARIDPLGVHARR